MKELKDSFRMVFRNERGVLAMMIVTFLLAAVLFVFAVVKIDPSSSVVRIGYGDIGGYSDGAWTNMIMYPVMAAVFGVLHNMLALKIYQKRGAMMTKFFLMVTMMLIVGMFLVISRLTKGA